MKKPIKILKKLTGSVRFRFYKPKTEKTESKQKKLEKKPSQIRKKTEPNRKNRVKPKKSSQTSLNRFCPKKPNRKRPV